jgi:hypothetical protein
VRAARAPAHPVDARLVMLKARRWHIIFLYPGCWLFIYFVYGIESFLDGAE